MLTSAKSIKTLNSRENHSHANPTWVGVWRHFLIDTYVRADEYSISFLSFFHNRVFNITQTWWESWLLLTPVKAGRLTCRCEALPSVASSFVCPRFLTCGCTVSSPHSETLWRLHFVSRVHCSLLDLVCSNQTKIYLTLLLGECVGVCIWNTHSWRSEWIRLYEGKQLYCVWTISLGVFLSLSVCQQCAWWWMICVLLLLGGLLFFVCSVLRGIFFNPSNILLLYTINWNFPHFAVEKRSNSRGGLALLNDYDPYLFGCLVLPLLLLLSSFVSVRHVRLVAIAKNNTHFPYKPSNQSPSWESATVAFQSFKFHVLYSNTWGKKVVSCNFEFCFKLQAHDLN